MSKKKGQSELLELLIIVVSVVLIIIAVYSLFTTTLSTSTELLSEKHKNDRVLFLCDFFPRIALPSLNHTMGEMMYTAISSDSMMVYYGLVSTPIDIDHVTKALINPYLDEGYWQLKLKNNMIIGSDIPPGVDLQSCKMRIPDNTHNYTDVYLYRWF